jgi:hypothetical protein
MVVRNSNALAFPIFRSLIALCQARFDAAEYGVDSSNRRPRCCQDRRADSKREDLNKQRVKTVKVAVD